jgi:NAD(P)H dehydrogenase (quinone)
MHSISVIFHSESGNTKAMAELIVKGARENGCDARTMPVDALDVPYLEKSRAVLFGSPTYYGTTSWQMKKLMDTIPVKLEGKLGAAFASAGWQGGGGYEFAEMTLIAGMLIRGMMIYSGGVVTGMPPTHFGAVSAGAPKQFDADRCVKLGANIAKKVNELWT